MEKFYLVECTKPPGRGTKFIVEASNHRNAINKVFNGYYKKENSKILENGYDVGYSRNDLTSKNLNFLTNNELCYA